MPHERTHRAITFDPAEGRTQQSQAASTDITRLVNKYLLTGEHEHISNAEAIYGEFTNVGDYQAAMESMKIAQNNFDGMPARIRTRFDNDPGQLVDFMSASEPGGANYDEAVELKLVAQPRPDPKNPPMPDPEPDPESEPE